MVIRDKKNVLNSCCWLLPVVFLIAFSLQATAQEIAAVPPQRQTVLQYIIQDKPLLVDLLTTAGLAPILSGSTFYTLLAPPEATLGSYKNLSPDQLHEMLSSHILEGKYQSKDFKDGAKIKTLAGSTIQVYLKDGDTFLNGVRLTKADHAVSNGIVLELDGCVKK